MNTEHRSHRHIRAVLIFFLGTGAALAQEQIDKAESRARSAGAIERISLRARVTKVAPEADKIRLTWRRGGEGLGGQVSRGEFAAENKGSDIDVNVWSAWLPLGEIVGRARGWEFPTIVVSSAVPSRNNSGKAQRGGAISETAVEFEFVENGKPFKRFTEAAPRGATVGFALPGSALSERVTPEFVAQLNGLSAHARERRVRLEKSVPGPVPELKHFGIIGHLGGYGDGPASKLAGGSGYGVRHCNPEILRDECRTLRMLGVNGVVGPLRAFDVAGFSNEFRHIYWGGPGSGDPMSFFKRGGKNADATAGCPFDPALKAWMMQRVEAAIAEHRGVGARESWALWSDEIGVFAKEHIASCERCAKEFRNYLRAEKVPLSDLGAAAWDEVRPYSIWFPASEAKTAAAKSRDGLAFAPTNAADALRYYYTFRFMTHATAQVFPKAAKKFTEASIPLYAMQGPTPSWSGASLDWHEFYDHDANTAFVWETSNRDPRVWQWESYLADIGRGIAARHQMPMGCLVKPHRGAPQQRMLAVVSRGVRVLEWYTYGPDYAKGDSFSQSPELLEDVAHGARFLADAEDWLYDAHFARQPEVAFVSPRSSEIWGKATDLGITAFENAKWVYLALRHAHIPVDVLSERQLAEGKLDGYKVIYVCGPNLRRDAAGAVKEWVRAGGSLWTDALGLSRDEANQTAAAPDEVFGVTRRSYESWGAVESYKATDIKTLQEPDAPANALVEFAVNGVRPLRVSIARETFETKTARVLARFSDGKPAIVQNQFGKGSVTLAGFWSGLTYSAKVRRTDFDMRADFDATVRDVIAEAALKRGVYRPIIPSEPLAESIVFEKDGRRCVALINWAFARGAGEANKGHLQSLTNLRLSLSGVGEVKSVRSLKHGPLALRNQTVLLPRLDEIDLLMLQ